MSGVELSQKFPLNASGKQAINKYIFNQGWSYRTFKSDPKRYGVLVYQQAKEQSCTFRIRLPICKNKEVELSALEPHPCPTSVRSFSMKYLLFYRATGYGNCWNGAKGAGSGSLECGEHGPGDCQSACAAKMILLYGLSLWIIDCFN